MAAVTLPPDSPPPRTSRMAILARWVGISALILPVTAFLASLAGQGGCEASLLLFVLTLPLAGSAVLLGFVAWFRISRNPHLWGEHEATVGYKSGGGGLLLLVVLLVLSPIRVGVPPCGEHWPPSGESVTVGSLRSINMAEVTYSATYPKIGFSRSLEALGGAPPCTASSTSACLIDDVLASGRKRGYVFVYTAGPPDAKGIITSYTLSARPAEFMRTGTRSFYTDESGVILFTTEDRAATAQDPPLQ